LTPLLPYLQIGYVYTMNAHHRATLHSRIEWFLLLLVVCSLPVSKFMLSIAQLLLAINWIAGGAFREKYSRLAEKPHLLWFAGLLLMYGAGLLYTENMTIGMQKFLNVLPVLLFTLVAGSAPPVPLAYKKLLLVLFSLSVLSAALICTVQYAVDPIPARADFRKISLFMLHIRFALLIILAICIMAYLAAGNFNVTNRPTRISFAIVALLLTVFLFFLRSFTGIVIFFLVVPLFLALLIRRHPNRMIRLLPPFLIAFIAGGTIAFTVFTLARYFTDHSNGQMTESHTSNGNPYSGADPKGTLENGNRTDLYVCETELRREWPRVSKLHVDSTDARGQQVWYTLVRYLTSKNLRKDSAGIHSLSEKDVAAIEAGYTNYRFTEKNGLNRRFYETLWEIHMWHRLGYVKRHSAGQRLVFLKAAAALIRQHPWQGSGTGDAGDDMLKQARTMQLEIEPRWEGKPHNQYAFFLVTFGIPATLVILFSWIWPAIKQKAFGNLLFNAFLAVCLLSMLNIDTLESYEGMVFFSFFYLFLSTPGRNP